ncbi:MAG: SprB repeat-containing protein [Bacteroidetes bacterium]|nr:SprB repeat-containing protein [Bacteroidota bacterium]
MQRILGFIVLTGLFFAGKEDCTHAQSITLGTGTAVNGTQTSSPVNIWYRRCVNQTVYTVAELNAAGITGPATIRQLGYYVTQAPAYAIPGYQISMKHTTATSASGNLEGGYTVVKSASTYTPVAGGWDLIDLTTPFSWNGTQNIVVRVCWTQVQPGYDASGQCRVYTTTGGYKYRWDDNAGGACGLVPNTTSTNKPQIHFIFDTVTVWTGALNSNWDQAGNWTKGIPNKYMDARIPTGTPNNPIVNTSVTCEELILEGAMTLATSGTLNVLSHFTSTGTFTDNGGTTVLQGTGASNLSGDLTFSNLHIESGGGTTVTGGTTAVTTELQVNKSVFNTGNAVVLKSTATGTARIAELKATCTYTLTMNDSYGDGWNGGYLTVLENGVSIGTFSASGTGTVTTFKVQSGSAVTVNYTAGSWENENSFTLTDPYGAIVLTDNAPITVGTLYSATADGPFTTMVQGSISMERYIDAGETYWRNFSSAVSGATVSMYLDDFLTAGFPGSPWPAFPFNSIYTYDETQAAGLGWEPCTGTTQVIGVGEGLLVWSGDTITGTNPFTLDLAGQANQGPITMPVTYTNTGTLEEDGWNLVGNPYASTIDWDSPNWTKTNIANAIYIQDPDNQQYATYVSGAGANGGSRYIASQQSFWVYASDVSPQLILNESCKSSVDQQFIKTGALSPGTIIRLEGAGYADESVIRHVDGSVNSFEMQYDAYERWGGWGEVLQLSLVTATEEDLTIHSFDLQGQEWVVPLRAVVFANGDYTLVFENIDELAVPCLKLEDTYTGLMYDITEGTSLPFTMSDTAWTPRFMLHIGKTYPTDQAPVTCYDAGNGSFELDLNDTGSFSYNLTLDGNTTTAASGGDPLSITNLYAGTYTLEIPSLVNNCSQTVFEFTIVQPGQLQSSAQIQDETNGYDGEIDVAITGGTPPYQYYWNNGSQTAQVTGLTSGNYLLEVTDFNGCMFENTYWVGSSVGLDELAENTRFVYQAEANRLRIFDLTSEVVYLTASNGQVVSVYKNLAPGFNELSLPSDLASGVYLVTTGVTGQYFKFTKN